MPLTAYPFGVSSFGVPVLPNAKRVYTGTVFFVSNRTGDNGSNSNPGTSPGQPFLTLAYAVTRVTANKDDVIYVMEGHAETIAAAAGIACAIAGFSIVGLGNGRAKPVFTWSATTSTWTITAANVAISNINTTSTIAAMATLFSITAAGATFDAVDYYEDGSTDALQFILTTTAADDLTVQNCHWYRGTTAASALSQWIVLTGVDRVKILNNFAILKGFATSNPINSIVVVVTTACVAMDVSGNRFYDSNSTGNASLLLLAGCTGVIADNRIGTSQGTLSTGQAVASAFWHENYYTNEVAKSGVLGPAADAWS